MPISHVAPLSHPAEALHSPRHSRGGAGIYRDGLLHVKFCRLSSPCRASKVKVCTETAMPVGLTGRNNMSRSEIAYAAISLNNGLKYGFFSTLLQVREEGECSVPWILWLCSSSSLLAGFLPRFFHFVCPQCFYSSGRYYCTMFCARWPLYSLFSERFCLSLEG